MTKRTTRQQQKHELLLTFISHTHKAKRRRRPLVNFIPRPVLAFFMI